MAITDDILELKELVRQLLNMISIYEAENALIKTENAELKSRLNFNSSNSSKPLSSDGYHKKPAFRKEKGGIQGGQKGLFEDFYDFPINESTIATAHKICYNNLQDTEKIIQDYILASPSVYSDESGIRCHGKLHWLHVAYNSLYTYLFIHKKRGKETVESSQSLLKRFNGWLIHDCWIRPIKVKQKVSGCFRTISGTEQYARIASFISTVRKNQHNVFEELCNSFNGYTFLTIPPAKY